MRLATSLPLSDCPPACLPRRLAGSLAIGPAAVVLQALVITGAVLQVFSRGAKFSLFKPAEVRALLRLPPFEECCASKYSARHPPANRSCCLFLSPPLPSAAAAGDGLHWAGRREPHQGQGRDRRGGSAERQEHWQHAAAGAAHHQVCLVTVVVVVGSRPREYV